MIIWLPDIDCRRNGHDFDRVVTIETQSGWPEWVTPELLECWLGLLPHRYEYALRRQLDGISQIEIARCLKISVGRAHQIIHKAAQMVRDWFCMGRISLERRMPEYWRRQKRVRP